MKVNPYMLEAYGFTPPDDPDDSDAGWDYIEAIEDFFGISLSPDYEPTPCETEIPVTVAWAEICVSFGVEDPQDGGGGHVEHLQMAY